MDAGTSISLKSDVLEKLKNALNDSSYKETIESSSNYNNRLVVERKTRIPFIDSQTGVAQNDCYLWMQKWERMPGITEGQLYSYPVRRWRKKRRSQYLLNNNYGLNVKQWEKNTEKTNSDLSCVNGFETTNESSITVKSIDGSHENNDKFFENTNKEDWIADIDDVNDLDNVDNDDIESDYDDEEYTNKKKKKKKNDSSNSSKKKKMDNNSVDKPYKCDMCGMKYKTRPGLSYHYSHTHSLDMGERKNINLDEDDSQHSNSSSMNSNANNGINSRTSQISNSTSNSPLPPNSFNQSQNSLNSNNKTNNLLNNQPGFPSNNVTPSSPVFNNKNEDSKPSSKYKKGSAPSNYCDFCLGNAEINKKTRSSEEMISCSDCGRSAHPTCLQFTTNMLLSVKKYRWQCIECKSCGLCGTSDNDDQLLFCDDCDRGYHMYCLKPPLSEPPEGSWSCHLCIEEYHKPKQPEPFNNSVTLNNLNNTNLATLLSTNNPSNPSLNLNKSSNSHSKLPQQLNKNMNSLTTSESTAEKS